MTIEYFRTSAAAFVRGRLIYKQQKIPASGAMPVITKALDELSDDEMEELLQIGKEHNLRLHRFKKSMELPRVRRVLGILKGESMVRQVLWIGQELTAPLPFVPREYIASLVRFHGLPLQFLYWTKPERSIIAASMRVRMDSIALLAEADVKGRICSDADELLERIALFREQCKECLCYDGPRQFPNEYSRFLYFQREGRDPDYVAYDDTEFEVILMSGLPGVGKDTWIRQHLKDQPIIALDALRKKLKIDGADDQGPVITMAKEQAREWMRKKQSFVWNATNVTRLMRQQIVELFLAYNARVRIVYLDAPFNIILQRNRNRQNSVPEQVIYKLLSKLEVPTVLEAHHVEWIYD